MNKKSILLAINGSEESLHAAELAWALARSLPATLKAQTVIETRALWRLMEQGRPGLIGSSPYIAAYQAACSAMRSVAEGLSTSYEARVGSAGVDSEFLIDEGDTVDEICRRAEENDLVIVGRRRSSTAAEQPEHVEKVQHIGQVGQLGHIGYVEYIEHIGHVDPLRLPRFSVTERLIYSCPRPLLVVQDRCQLWKTIRYVISDASYNPESLQSFLKFTEEWFSVPREILCVATKKTLEELLLKVKLELASSKGVTVKGHGCSMLEPAWWSGIDVVADTLAVTALGYNEGGSKHCLGIDPAIFVRAMKSSALLFLPAETQTNAVAAPATRNIRDVSCIK